MRLCWALVLANVQVCVTAWVSAQIVGDAEDVVSGVGASGGVCVGARTLRAKAVVAIAISGVPSHQFPISSFK